MTETNAGPAVAPAAAPPTRHPFSLLAYAQLLRIPNVFTAMADIGMAALVVGALPDQLAPFLLVLASSCCLYCGGMVWNDWFDLERDKRERPFRPLPSGRVSPGTAAVLGAVLLAAGVALAGLAGAAGDTFRVMPLVWAGLLVAAILLYDGGLKKTPVGPVAMGSCRVLNVLLGLSVAAGGMPVWGIVPAMAVGVYIAGVTWFARREAAESNPYELLSAAAVMGFGLMVALAVPAVGTPAPRDDTGDLLAFAQMGLGQVLFPYLLVAFGAYLGVAIHAAVTKPSPQRVQAAVKRAVLGLILLDALLAASIAGTVGLALALLLVPARILGRRMYST
jgi:4-hydroxybenzoate polyprenyltransferase